MFIVERICTEGIIPDSGLSGLNNIVLYILSPLLAWAGYDTRSTFKLCLSGLNLVIFLFKSSWNTKIREPSLPNYSLGSGGKYLDFYLSQEY